MRPQSRRSKLNWKTSWFTNRPLAVAPSLICALADLGRQPVSRWAASGAVTQALRPMSFGPDLPSLASAEKTVKMETVIEDQELVLREFGMYSSRDSSVGR
mmetsp:Transcript_136789/g.266068  ORF Transcript_136789/g.266068 Transcript_136789/m.266068 type:complete len:101 (+) Transcript_136789:1793-2095(+)